MKNDLWKPILGILLILAAFRLQPSPVPTPPQPVVPPPVVVVEPATNPFSSENLAVLIVEDGSKRHQLPVSQVSVFTSAILDKWLKDNRVEARFWDITESGELDAPKFREAAKVKRDSVPWIYVAHGRKGASQPLPLTVEKTIELVDRYK